MEKGVTEIKEVFTERVLNVNNVANLYSKCLLTNSDFDIEGLTCNFSVGEGVTTRCAFSTERLNDNRESIACMIEQLHGIECAPSLMNLYYNNEGKQWTDEAMVVEMLVQMGTAANMISFLYPPEVWKLLPGGVPYVSKNVYNLDKKLYGINGYQYSKVFGISK